MSDTNDFLELKCECGKTILRYPEQNDPLCLECTERETLKRFREGN
jgi:hypothetical protein